jgi:hypothetical protein
LVVFRPIVPFFFVIILTTLPEAKPVVVSLGHNRLFPAFGWDWPVTSQTKGGLNSQALVKRQGGFTIGDTGKNWSGNFSGGRFKPATLAMRSAGGLTNRADWHRPATQPAFAATRRMVAKQHICG